MVLFPEPRRAAEGEFLLFTVTFCANPANKLTPLKYYEVTWSDGSTTTLYRRERPQVLLNAEHEVEVLYTGVCCRNDGNDPQQTYTLAVPTTAYTG